MKQVRLFLRSIERQRRAQHRAQLLLLRGAQDDKAFRKLWDELEEKEP